MKTTFLLTAVQNGARRIPTGLVVAAAIFLHHNAMAQVTLGSDLSTFGVLAGTTITVAAPVNSTTIYGNIGVAPGSAVTGLGNFVLLNGGANQTLNAITTLAQTELTTAYNQAAGLGATTIYAAGVQNLAGLSLGPGVYREPTGSGAFLLTVGGTLILDAHGNANATWVFQSGSTLTAQSGSRVTVINGGSACNVFWQVASSATIGTGVAFEGTILAHDSIALQTGATMDGAALAEHGAVTLDNNTITGSACGNVVGIGTGGDTGGGTGGVPDSGSTLLLLSSALATLVPFRRRFFPRLNS